MKKGFVFHYPCYFAPPLSVIRLGDYKLMRHIRTREVRLFDLKNDYFEKQNLAQKFPEKVAEIEEALDTYLEKIDAENLDEVYEARFEQLDKFESQAAVSQYENNIKHLDIVADAEKIKFLKISWKR